MGAFCNREHSAILSNFIKLPFGIRIFFLFLVAPLKAGFTVFSMLI